MECKHQQNESNYYTFLSVTLIDCPIPQFTDGRPGVANSKPLYLHLMTLIYFPSSTLDYHQTRYSPNPTHTQ